MKKYSILIVMAIAFLLMVGSGTVIAGEKCAKGDAACAKVCKSNDTAGKAKCDTACAGKTDCTKKADCKKACDTKKCDPAKCKPGQCDMSKCKPAGTTTAPKAETKK
ncbi:MAG: hypothetical protein IPH75_03850 [bacterium]|nr:hypothetical protein [bacterium]